MADVILTVSSTEQVISLNDGTLAQVLYNPFNRYWYMNMVKDGEVVAAGMALIPNTNPLKNFGVKDTIFIIDTVNDNLEYNPYNELGSRLSLVEHYES